MQRYSVADALYLSFFSKSFYRDVAVNWTGLGLRYLAALLVLCAIPGVLRMQTDIRDWVEKEVPAYVKQVPVMEISKGVLSLQEPQPYRIVNEKTGDPLIIIDTTGQTVSLEGSRAAALLTRTDAFIRKSPKVIAKYSLTDLGSETITIDRKSVYEFMDALVDAVPIALYPFALGLFFLITAFEALVYALMSRIQVRRLGLDLDMRSLMRVSVVAMTPALLLGSILLVVGVVIPYWWLLSLIISVSYVIYGVRANLQNPIQEQS